ncbi:MAG: hypothetical protein HW373_1595 [Deltaproteobacteria bacterium]|nr:hypothetical protein [Deltaproteobacteria bacterium]
MFLFVALSAGLLAIAFIAAVARKMLPAPDPHTRWDWATYIPTEFRRLRVRALAAARSIRITRFTKRHWQSGVLNLVICTTPIIAALVSIGFYHVYFDKHSSALSFLP